RSEYLGGGGFSLLFNKGREEKKLVYEIGTTANVNKGEIIITAKVNKENIQNVIKRVDEEILKLQRGVIDELHYLSTLNSLNLTEARNIDRPLTLTRSYINYLTNVKREKKFSKDEFECLIKQVKKAVTVSVTEV
ncbi:insulinase family protein, partial [Alcanivoracaceae bacterium MT1]